jgi:hypothetical protein
MLSIDLMMEMGRRVQPDRNFWRPDTAALAREAAQQAAYCLDAPDDIPAGGMYADEIAGEPLPMPMTVDRETPNVAIKPRRQASA